MPIPGNTHSHRAKCEHCSISNKTYCPVQVSLPPKTVKILRIITKRKTVRAKIGNKFEISAADPKANSVIITDLHAKDIVVNEKGDSKLLTDLSSKAK